MILQDERKRQPLDRRVVFGRGGGIAGDDVGDGDEQLPPVGGRAQKRLQASGKRIGAEADAGELVDRMLRRRVDAQGGDGDIVRNAQTGLQQMGRGPDGGAVGGAEDGGNIVFPHDLGQVRPDVRVAARVHDDLHRVERQVHLQDLPLEAAEDDQVLIGGKVLIDIDKAAVAQLRQPADQTVGRGGIVPADVEKRLAAEIPVQHQNIRRGGGDQIELAAVELVERDEQHAAGELGGKILHELRQRENVQLRVLLRGKVRNALQQRRGRHPQSGAGNEHDGARIGADPGGRRVVQLLHDLENVGARRFGDALAAVDGQRNGGGGDTGALGNVLICDLSHKKLLLCAHCTYVYLHYTGTGGRMQVVFKSFSKYIKLLADC